MGWCLEPSYSVWTFPSHFDDSFHNTHNSIPLIGFVSILTNKTLFIPNLSHLLAWITYPIATTFLSMFVMSWIILDKLLGAHTPASASILQNSSCTPQEKGFKVTNKGSSVGISLKHYLSKLETLTSRNDTFKTYLNPADSVTSTRTPQPHTLGYSQRSSITRFTLQAPGEAATRRVCFVRHQLHSTPTKAMSAFCF